MHQVRLCRTKNTRLLGGGPAAALAFGGVRTVRGGPATHTNTHSGSGLRPDRFCPCDVLPRQHLGLSPLPKRERRECCPARKASCEGPKYGRLLAPAAPSRSLKQSSARKLLSKGESLQSGRDGHETRWSMAWPGGAPCRQQLLLPAATAGSATFPQARLVHLAPFFMICCRSLSLVTKAWVAGPSRGSGCAADSGGLVSRSKGPAHGWNLASRHKLLAAAAGDRQPRRWLAQSHLVLVQPACRYNWLS